MVELASLCLLVLQKSLENPKNHPNILGFRSLALATLMQGNAWQELFNPHLIFGKLSAFN
jgi:hypothetical protein